MSEAKVGRFRGLEVAALPLLSLAGLEERLEVALAEARRAPGDQAMLCGLGAVGDVCMRFFDADGKPVDSSLYEGSSASGRRSCGPVPRRIGVADGPRKPLVQSKASNAR